MLPTCMHRPVSETFYKFREFMNDPTTFWEHCIFFSFQSYMLLFGGLFSFICLIILQILMILETLDTNVFFNVCIIMSVMQRRLRPKEGKIRRTGRGDWLFLGLRRWRNISQMQRNVRVFLYTFSDFRALISSVLCAYVGNSLQFSDLDVL